MLSKLYVFWMIVPAAMSVLMTSVNSVSASPIAPLSASVRSWARRASDSMTRSSTMSCAHRLAVRWSIDGLNDMTLDGMVTAGSGGRTQTLAEADPGVIFPGGGSAAPALLNTHVATSGPDPTVTVSFGVEPSGSSGAGSGLCRENSADTGRAVSRSSVTPSVAGAAQPI